MLGDDYPIKTGAAKPKQWSDIDPETIIKATEENGELIDRSY